MRYWARLKTLNNSKFFKNVVAMVSGTTLAQLLPLIVSPILTRYYTETDFGIMGIVTSVSAILIVASSGRYQMAIMLPRENQKAYSVFLLALIISLLSTAVILIIVTSFPLEIEMLLGVDGVGHWLIYIPIIVLVAGLWNILNMWVSRAANFRINATSKVLQSSFNAGASVGLSKLTTIYFSAGGLIIGRIVGFSAVCINMLRFTINDIKRLGLFLDLREIKETAIKFKEYPKYNLLPALLDTLAINALFLVIGKFYSINELGYFQLTSFALIAPVALISTSIRDVLYQRFTKIIHEGKNPYPFYIKVVMMGLGYIGLPTAALIASKGINVLGVDVQQNVVDTINNGKIHIVEPALDGLVKHDVERGHLKAAIEPRKADVFLVAVPTPFKEDHLPDLKYVESATNMVLPYLEEGNLFIIESTSPVGTTEKMADLIFAKRPELKGVINIAYCPERVLPGNVIYELKNNDRAIGGIDEDSTNKASEFYRLFVSGELHETNARTAKMTKLVENASRDVQIAFANELSMICDEADIDVWELINLANKHPRVNILQPGTGVGGHCIAVDPWFIVSEFKEKAKIIRAAREINNYKTEWVIEKIKNTALEFELKEGRKPKIACLGLAFKPDIDDLRESPAVYVALSLIQEDLDVSFVEPNLEKHRNFKLVKLDIALKNSDIVVYLVAHKEVM
jgi:UDP-N-acetyl-D-mannosaminuronic acid dehydrogenase